MNMQAPEDMDLSIIIVNWNSKEYLEKCIQSILVWTVDIKYEIIVIDGASFDGCGEMLQRRFPQVRFIQSQENVGFAKANNVAFHESRGGYILFLNPDTELIGPAINIMFDYIQKVPNSGAIGCKLLNADKTVQTSCLQAFPTLMNQLLDSELLRRLWPNSPLWGNAHLFSSQITAGAVEGIVGACIMVERTLFEKVGLFSEDYFMYAEDLDLCYKIKQAGYMNYYLPDASIIHFGGGSTEKSPSDFSVVMMRESVWRMMRKTRGNGYGFAYRVSTMISSIGRLIALMAVFPLHLIRRGGQSWNGSFRKWRAILTWSLGLKNVGF
jgi:GT2 family glycosyltransferase